MDSIKGNLNRMLVIDQKVDNSAIRDITIPLMLMDNDGTGDPITIILSVESSGGIFSVLPLCDVIDNLKTPTQIFLLNYAFGAEAFILMAGYSNPLVVKKCFKHSTVNLYPIDEQFVVFKGYEKLFHELLEYVQSHTSIPEEKYNDFFVEKYVMNSQELLEYGFVDIVIGED